jgi:hypothetical protein
MASYDSSQHLEDYRETTAELSATVNALREVEIGLAEQRITNDLVLQGHGQLLDQILEAVR